VKVRVTEGSEVVWFCGFWPFGLLRHRLLPFLLRDVDEPRPYGGKQFPLFGTHPPS
jgi:hypothetical protein